MSLNWEKRLCPPEGRGTLWTVGMRCTSHREAQPMPILWETRGTQLQTNSTANRSRKTQNSSKGQLQSWMCASTSSNKIGSVIALCLLSSCIDRSDWSHWNAIFVSCNGTQGFECESRMMTPKDSSFDVCHSPNFRVR